MDSKNLAYDPNYGEMNKGTSKQISKTVQDMKSEMFQEQFNELFENNHMGNQPDPSRNEWFTQEKSDFDIPGGKMSGQMMNEQFQTIKQQSNGLIRYNGVQTINQDHSTNNHLYQEEDDNSYVSSDPFGKLKFDDLRKVHRDQSILAVSENDIHNIQTYKSVEEFNQARNQHSYDPMEKQHADKLLQEQEQAMRNKMMQKEYRSKLEIEQNEAKNKAVLSSFLMLQNKK